MTKVQPKHSAIYNGNVTHRRFEQQAHNFNYPLYMMAVDLDELEQGQLNRFALFGTQWFKAIRFKQQDYLNLKRAADNSNRQNLTTNSSLRERITTKLKELGAKDSTPDKVTLLVQCRCFGIYFSPANFIFCYDKTGQCTQLLVEVSNTPWNKRHYYLVDMTQAETQPSEKTFHVSPFMDLDMSYHWQVKAPSHEKEKLSVHIENRRTSSTKNSTKAFDATLKLDRRPLTNKQLFKVWVRQPMMTFAVVKGIYVQAFHLFRKKIKFVPYQVKQTDSTAK